MMKVSLYIRNHSSREYGELISFSRSAGGAKPFAEFSVTGCGVLYAKHGMKVFLDYVLLGKYLEKLGMDTKAEDELGNFHPIKEREVIVELPPRIKTLTMSPDEVIEVFVAPFEDESGLEDLPLMAGCSPRSASKDEY